MDVDDVFARWTHLYHVTFALNLPSIRKRRRLVPAATLLDEAGYRPWIASRRLNDLPLRIDDQAILLRNQSALRLAALELEAGTIEDYVSCLNARTYFWPGSAMAPAEDGLRMLFCGGAVPAVLIRVETRSLLTANAGTRCSLSACNSGATWTECGRKSRRGPAVFETLQQFSRSADQIAEISFSSSVRLPADATYVERLGATWTSLFKP